MAIFTRRLRSAVGGRRRSSGTKTLTCVSVRRCPGVPQVRRRGSVRQLAPWLRQERIDLPIVCLWPSRTDRIAQWGPPRYNTIHRLLTNPVYAGAYVFGRTGSRVRFAEGRKVITRGVHRRRDEWEVLIRDHHNGYISWEEYELNQKGHRGQRQHERRHGAGSVRNGGRTVAAKRTRAGASALLGDARAGNMMRSIPINDRWPASLNVGGMNVSRCRAA